MKHVYFLRPVGQLGPIKIGCSKLPQSRLDSVTIWSPMRLEFICSVPGSHTEERTLHGMFAKHRVHGEWFGASKELLTLIDHCAATGALPELPKVIKFPRTNHVGFRGRSAGKSEAGALPPHKMVQATKFRCQYEGGVTASQIADETGLHIVTVCKYIRVAGGTVQRGPRAGQHLKGVSDPARAEEFKRRYLGGETLQQIAIDYGLTRERVRQILRKTNVATLGHRPEHCRQVHELTKAEIAAAKAYQSGASPKLIIEQYGVTAAQLNAAIHRLGIEIKGAAHWLTRSDDAEITAKTAELYTQGLSPREIVERVPQLKFPPTIYRYLKKAGVPVRTKKGRFGSRSA